MQLLRAECDALNNLYDTKVAALKVEHDNDPSLDYHDMAYQQMLGTCDASTSVQKDIFYKPRRYARTQQPDTEETSDAGAGLPPGPGPSKPRPAMTLTEAMKNKMPPPASTSIPESAFGRAMGHLDEGARLALQLEEEQQRAKAQKKDQAATQQALKNRPKAASPPKHKGLGVGKGGVKRGKKGFIPKSSSESDLFGSGVDDEQSGGDDDPSGGGDDDPSGGDDDDEDDDNEDASGDDEHVSADDEHNSSVERDKGKQRRKAYYPKNQTPYFEFPNISDPQQMVQVMYTAMATFTNAMAAESSSTHIRLRRVAAKVNDLKIMVQELRLANAEAIPALEFTEADKAELIELQKKAGFPLRSLEAVEEWFNVARNYDLLKAKIAKSSITENTFCSDVMKQCVHGFVITAGTYMPPLHE